MSFARNSDQEQQDREKSDHLSWRNSLEAPDSNELLPMNSYDSIIFTCHSSNFGRDTHVLEIGPLISRCNRLISVPAQVHRPASAPAPPKPWAAPPPRCSRGRGDGRCSAARRCRGCTAHVIRLGSVALISELERTVASEGRAETSAPADVTAGAQLQRQSIRRVKRSPRLERHRVNQDVFLAHL